MKKQLILGLFMGTVALVWSMAFAEKQPVHSVKEPGIHVKHVQPVAKPRPVSKPVTFAVDDVEPNTDLLRDTNFNLAVQETFEKLVYITPEERANSRMAPVYSNGFAACIDKAYTYHYPLTISPDDIWLLICQGIAHHVNSNPKKYEDLMLNPVRPDKIVVRNDSLVNLASKDFADLINSFSAEVKPFLKNDAKAFFVRKFSTTTPEITTVYETTLLETVKSYFSFYGMSGCGIPSVTLTGTADDWNAIYNGLDELKKYDLGFWVKELKPVIKEFVNAYNGKPDKKFWQGIYKDAEMYGASYISGWMLKLYPYIVKNEYKNAGDTAMTVEPSYVQNPYLAGNEYLFSNLSVRDLPKGYTNVPFTWINLFEKEEKNQNKRLEIKAGFVGLERDKNTNGIKPVISWVICEEEAQMPEEYLSLYNKQPMHKNGTSFSPDITSKPLTMPVFNPEKNKNYATGMQALKKYIEENVKEASLKNEKRPLKVKFIVTWMGTIEHVDPMTSNTALSKEIVHIMEKCPYKWRPGTVGVDRFGPNPYADVYGNVELEMEL